MTSKHRREPAREALAAQDDPLEPLTQREREVAHLIAEGHTNKEIASKLVISPRTAEEHASNVLKKLELPSRAAVGVLLHVLAPAQQPARKH